jgi:gluconolactonase
MPGFGVQREPELDFHGVYRLAQGEGDTELVVDRASFTQFNGLCFSRLYVNDTDQANIRVFDVRPDGSLGSERIFATDIFETYDRGVRDDDLGVPDVMKCDESDNFWRQDPAGCGYTPKVANVSVRFAYRRRSPTSTGAARTGRACY